VVVALAEAYLLLRAWVVLEVAEIVPLQAVEMVQTGKPTQAEVGAGAYMEVMLLTQIMVAQAEAEWLFCVTQTLTQ